MTILYVRPKIDREGTTGENGQKTYAGSYTLKSDDPGETIASILASGAIPVYGSPHPEDGAATCCEINPKRNLGDPLFWTVEVKWSRTAHSGSEPDKQKPPDQRRPKWSCKFVPLAWNFPCDLDGKPFVSSAHTPFDPPPQMPIYVDEVTIQRYETRGGRASDRSFQNAVNADKFLSCDPGEALMADIQVHDVFEFNAYWFEYTYRVLLNPRQRRGGRLRSRAVARRRPQGARRQQQADPGRRGRLRRRPSGAAGRDGAPRRARWPGRIETDVFDLPHQEPAGFRRLAARAAAGLGVWGITEPLYEESRRWRLNDFDRPTDQPTRKEPDRC